MAVLTSNTILNFSTTKEGTYSKLVDITSYPDIGGEPEQIEVTDLSTTTYKQYINGLQDISSLTFEANYTKAGYDAVVALADTVTWFQLSFGDSGVDGIFQWSGKVSVYISGGAANEARKMSLTISSETEFTDETPA